MREQNAVEEYISTDRKLTLTLGSGLNHGTFLHIAHEEVCDKCLARGRPYSQLSHHTENTPRMSRV